MNEDGRQVEASTSPLVANDTLIFPLSFAQQRFWILDRLESDSAVYNIPLAFRVEGTLEIGALEKSIATILGRHEVLRAGFEQQDGSPVQVIRNLATAQVHFQDLTALPPESRETEARRLLSLGAGKPFNLSHPPLFRTLLLKLGDKDHVLLFTFHHIIFDGWSSRVFLGELISIYNRIKEGQPVELPDLPLQYTDYAVWQREALSHERLQKQLQYWKDKLAGAPGLLNLPTDFPRPARQSFRGAKLTTTLSSGLVSQLKLLSSREGTTLFMTLLAAFDVLLARHTGQQDIVVGSPVAGRDRMELENLIGLFVNTLVFRTDFADNPSFCDLLKRVRETTLGAYSHQDLSFEKIVDELKPERDLSRNPLFQVMFGLQNMPGDPGSAEGLKVKPFVADAKTTSKFDLSVTIVQKGDVTRATFEYCTDLFSPATIARMQQHFVHLLEGIAADPEKRISELPMLTAEEKDELATFNRTEVQYARDVCLHHFFEGQAKKTPDAVAVIDGEKRISYAELNRRANQLAHYLRRQGAAPDVPIALCLERTAEMLVAVLGVLKSGAAYVPLDPAYPTLRLKWILEDASPALVLTQRSLLAKLSGVNAPLVCVDQLEPEISAHSTQNPDAVSTPENLAYILFTSGSTGRPKGVALEHRNAANFVHWAQSVFSPDELAGTLFATSLCFDLSIFEIFVPWSCGGKVIISENILALANLPGRAEVTLINTVPSALAEVVHSRRMPSSVQTINLGGEALPRSLVNDVYALGHVRNVYNLYGPTETTTYSSWALMRPDAQISIGRPIANTQIYVLDGNQQLAPIGVCGRLYIGGQGLARGYWKRPDLTAERFLPNPIAPAISPFLYDTGDLGCFMPDGTLHYLGRSDKQVKLRGYRIELAEIEKALEKHPAVQQSAVVMRGSGVEAQLAAYVLRKPGSHCSAEDLRTQLGQTLPAYMAPSSFTVLDHFPLTANGKVNVSALPEPKRPVQSSTAPRDVLEGTLLQIWEQVLGVSDIGITDNFFELGGHSLLAVRLVFEIEKYTGKALPLAALFQNATIEQLADIIRADQRQAHQMVVAVQARGEKPPFFGIVVPGANPLGFVALARHLGKDQPLYEIQGPGPRLRRPYTPREFEELAAEYIRSMKTIQPQGPYYFGGMCEGARIAFDMARLLEAEGETVGLLAILDTWVLENSQNRFLWKIDYFSKRVKAFWRSSLAEKRRRVRQWLAHRYGSSRPELLWPKAYWPGKNFVPGQYSGKITLFKVRKQPFYYVRDPLMGWGTRTSGKVEVQLIESKHLALLREPHVRALAPKLSECLERGRPGRECEQKVQIALPSEKALSSVANSV